MSRAVAEGLLEQWGLENGPTWRALRGGYSGAGLCAVFAVEIASHPQKAILGAAVAPALLGIPGRSAPKDLVPTCPGCVGDGEHTYDVGDCVGIPF